MLFKEKYFWHEKIFLILLYFSWILYAASLVAYFGFHLKPLSEIIEKTIKIYIFFLPKVSVI